VTNNIKEKDIEKRREEGKKKHKKSHTIGRET
jgi:hypothetical protein